MMRESRALPSLVQHEVALPFRQRHSNTSVQGGMRGFDTGLADDLRYPLTSTELLKHGVRMYNGGYYASIHVDP